MHSTKHKTIQEIEKNRVGFSLAFIVIFTGVFIILAILDVLPDPSAGWRSEHGGAPVVATDTAVKAGETPVRIVIDAISLDATVANPITTNADVLDADLLKGAVRFPSSALLGVNGTVLLFGHSSYLPIVRNLAYKTFDGIQKLKTGDSISVYSSTKEYRYRVTGVRMANVNDPSQSTILLPSDAPHLTLVTCDSFKTKSDRFIVTADFSGEYTLAQ